MNKSWRQCSDGSKSSPVWAACRLIRAFTSMGCLPKLSICLDIWQLKQQLILSNNKEDLHWFMRCSCLENIFAMLESLTSDPAHFYVGTYVLSPSPPLAAPPTFWWNKFPQELSRRVLRSQFVAAFHLISKIGIIRLCKCLKIISLYLF